MELNKQKDWSAYHLPELGQVLFLHGFSGNFGWLKTNKPLRTVMTTLTKPWYKLSTLLTNGKLPKSKMGKCSQSVHWNRPKNLTWISLPVNRMRHGMLIPKLRDWDASSPTDLRDLGDSSLRSRRTPDHQLWLKPLQFASHSNRPQIWVSENSRLLLIQNNWLNPSIRSVNYRAPRDSPRYHDPFLLFLNYLLLSSIPVKKQRSWCSS